ncbi:MAG: Ig-like domain-containing protein [Deltaproteobacteria bacterium]|nr:Ig-like domain-containing protein [Deltaproteobacteria bacterium]
MNSFRPTIATVVALLLVWGVGAESAAAGDHYLCYRAKPARADPGGAPFPTFAPRSGDAVIDALGSFAAGDQHLRDIKRAIGLCTPAEVDGQAALDDATHLDVYAVTRTRTVPPQALPLPAAHEMVDEFGTLRLGVRAADRVFVPAGTAGGTGGAPPPAPGGVDTFACYPAKAARTSADTPAFSPRSVVVQDALGARTLQLTQPTRVCAPADLNGADASAPAHAGHLVCYRARLARMPVPQPRFENTVVSTYDTFGPEVLAMTAIEELCVPSLKDPPHPTTTPLVVPSGVRRTATPRMPTFTPARTPTPSRTRTPPPSRTATVVATPTLSPTPTLSATPTATRTPPPTRSATPRPTRSPTPTVSPTPVGAPTRLFVIPATRAISEDASTNFTAIAEFRNGATQNYTQKVTWSSSKDTIATVSNDTGTRGRATGHRPGTVTISVRDPVSGRASADDDSATLTVLGQLMSITLAPSETTLHVGDHVGFAATGHYAGGSTQNLTQKVTYSSSDSAVVLATNADGNRSDVQAVGEGSAVISATDPNTGVSSSPAGDAAVTVAP